MIFPMLTIRWRLRLELNCQKHTGRVQRPKEGSKEEQCLMMCMLFPFCYLTCYHSTKNVTISGESKNSICI